MTPLHPVFSKGDPILHYYQISLLKYGIFPRKILDLPYVFLKEYSINFMGLKTHTQGTLLCREFDLVY